MTTSATVSMTPVTAALLQTLLRDRGEFERITGSAIPDGWPEFPEAIEHTLAAAREPGFAADWSMHLFFSAAGELVGSGGYHGPPSDGTVEIGYEIAPAFRGRGYAKAAARALVAKATAAGVARINAHTVAAESPSTGVLRALGFRQIGAAIDSADGPLWQWRLPVGPD
ncbi:GCN5-related N-acetyltransferase OS=Tsukamurella paurometabola (strain ATCC 8368 / DSM / CCUG 35730 / CIP 100753 / JCM 10117 / KCTC 9821 / NBRC 16120 /NCIMB 702349 / NCTC 13040) OX=521096 GN=Tpau_0769 PE=4 SV=1 [Tsukamurella paurometabola]|uniref:GCN5-related N-acetyltransferase n=1 Tax=Tsukamurella paurometabola (strain ATCC 8368 / DSM 20162 / CCUG 35730 / CIP 100753 / JCM 10117 / KCTC 9821 / NBRC 16120 / NCIMB 702349 / NCTC 13040) TaxID=521096 RepID=D5UTQ1_TSUPD|nr:GNAT family protein [Tsukamurella paurometabola]ADG77405.1 GCN5-related N-acetyltransferase [Tsukamurella paurometabola DSM 20162]SUP26918.1 Acetyltransferase (GNAT) family [Tsukamurella paurometabola]